MKIVVNGAPRDVAEESTVADVVTSVTSIPSGVAVALNGELVTRGRWSSATLHESDRLEVLSATAGG